jgi:hypothetical protein
MDTKRNKTVRPDRANTRTVAAHFQAETVDDLKRFLIYASYRQGKLLTVRDAVGAGLALLMKHYGETVPEELASLAPPPRRSLRPRPRHSSKPDA